MFDKINMVTFLWSILTLFLYSIAHYLHLHTVLKECLNTQYPTVPCKIINTVTSSLTVHVSLYYVVSSQFPQSILLPLVEEMGCSVWKLLWWETGLS